MKVEGEGCKNDNDDVYQILMSLDIRFRDEGQTVTNAEA